MNNSSKTRLLEKKPLANKVSRTLRRAFAGRVAALLGLKSERKAFEAEKAALRAKWEAGTGAPIRTLLEAGRVLEARQLVELLLKASPSPQLEQWARILAPPVVRVSDQATGTSGSSDQQWLRAHAKEYADQWVALREGTLLGADASRVALHQRLQRSDLLEGALFVRL